MDQGSFTDNDGKHIDNGQFFVAFDSGKFSGETCDRTITALIASITEQEDARLPNARRDANMVHFAKHGLSIGTALYEALKGLA